MSSKTTPTTPDHEPWLTVEECSAATGLPGWRIKRLAYAKTIPFSKPFGQHGRMLVRASDVRAFIDAAVTPATSGPLAERS